MLKNHDTISQRLALILIKLNAGERLSLDELAKEFNVSLRTIQRDMKRLGYLPIKCENGLYSLEEYYLVKLSFQDIREFAILSGIKDLYPSLEDDFLVELLDSKINRALLVRGYNYEDSSAKLQEFQTIELAILSHKKLRFIYKSKKRVVNPYKLVNNHGCWYVVADEEGILKNFALTKMTNVSFLEEEFLPNEDFLQIIKEQKVVWPSQKSIEVVLKVDKEVAEYFERKKLLPSQEIIEKKDDALIVLVKVSFEDEIIRIVRYWIPHITIISPQDLQVKLEASLHEYLQRHPLS